MTTPGGGGEGSGNNEIELVVRTVVEGDATEIVRAEGERVGAAFNEGVGSVPPVTLRGPNTDEMYHQIDAGLERIEQRVKDAARNMSLSLNEGSSGSAGLFGHDLTAEMERYQVAMESYGGGVKETFVGGFAAALENDTRRLAQGYDYLQEVQQRGKSIWALNEEGRTFLARAGERTSSGDTSGYFQGSTFPTPPKGGWQGGGQGEAGDLDRIRAQAQEALTRVTLDDARYALENGEFFKVSKSGGVLRAQGAVDNPELQTRLAAAIQTQMAGLENDIVAQHLRELAARPGNAFSAHSIDPVAQYPTASGHMAGEDLGGVVQEGVSSGTVAGLAEALDVLKAIGVEAPEVLRSLENALVNLVTVQEEAARAAQREALETQDANARAAEYAATLNRLQSAYAPGVTLPNPPVVPEELHGLLTPQEMGERNYQEMLSARRAMAEAAEQERLAQEAIRREMEAAAAVRREAFNAQFNSPEAVAARQAQKDAEDQARRERNAANFSRIDPSSLTSSQRDVYEALRLNHADLGGGGGGGGVPPRAPGAAGFPDDNPEIRAAMARLEQLSQITQAEIDAGRLTGFRKADIAREGSRLDGDLAVRGQGDDIYRVKGTGTLEQITQADALMRAQSDLTLSTRAQAEAEEALARSNGGVTQSYAEMTAAQLRAIDAQLKLNAAVESNDPGKIASAMERQKRATKALEEERQGPEPQRNFLQAFGHAALGGDKSQDAGNAFLRLNSDNGEFLGAIARYQAAYAVIFGLSQALHSVMDEESQVQRAMIEFSEATGTAGERADSLAESMARLGSRSGLGAAESIEIATRGAFAFGDETRGANGEPDPGRAAAVGTTSVQTTAMAAFITQAKDAGVVQGQLIATTRSFNLTAEDQGRVLDAAANAARHYGAATGDILAGLPGVAAIAHQAGLSVEETANIISVAAVRTAQTGTAVSTAIGRVLETIDSKPQTKSLLDTFGIDTTGTAGQTLESLAHHWKDLTAAQQDQVIASLGGVRAAKDLLPVLQEGDNLLKATEESYKQGGYAQELYYKQLNTLGGILKTISGDLGLIGHDLANTGLFTVFGAALKTIDPFLQGIDDILRVLDGLNAATHGWLIPLAEVAAVLAVIAKQMATISTEQAIVTTEAEAESAATTRSGLSRLVPFGLGRGAGAAKGAMQLEGLSLESGGAMTGALTGEVVATETAATSGLAALGGVLLGPVGIIAGLVGMTVAVGAVTAAMHAETEARKVANAAQTELRTSGSNPDNYRSAASALSAAAVQQEHANSGFGGFFAASGQDRARPDLLRTQAAYANEEATRLEAQQRALAGANAQDVYFTHTDDRVKDLTNGLAAMSEAGVPAVRALELLNAQINGLGGGGRGGARPLTGVFGTEANIASLTGQVQSTLSGFKPTYDQAIPRDTPQGFWDWAGSAASSAIGAGGGAASAEMSRDRTISTAASKLGGIDPAKIRDGITSVLEERGLGAADVIDAPTQALIADSVIKHLGLDKILTKPGQDAANKAIRAALAAQFSGLATAGGPPPMTDAEFKQLIEGDKKNNPGLAANLQALSAQDDPTQLDSSRSRLQAQLVLLRGLAAQGHTGGDQTILLEQLHKTEADYVKSEVDRLERLRQHAAGIGGTPEALAASEAKYVTAEARTAIQNNDPAELLNILNSASQATIDAVRHALEMDLKIAQAAYDKTAAAWKAWQSIPAQIRQHDPDLVGQGPAAPDHSGVDAAAGALGTFNSTTGQVTGKSNPPQDPDALGLSNITSKADSNDAVQSARIAVQAAQYTLDHAKNQTERNNAQKALNDANHQLTQAIAAHTEAMRSADVDPRDTVGAARTAVDNARTALHATEKGTTAYYQALANLNQAKQSLAQAEQGLAAAVAAANVRQGDPLSAATAALHAADSALQNELRGTVGWYNALGAFHAAQYAYGQALLAHQHEVRLNSLDLTDPVAMANENLRAARATLARDQHNGTGDIAADKNAVTSATNAAQDAAFQQRFHDIQYAHDMGTMSDQAYLAYLNSESRRLHAVAHRTRQQTEEMQQMDEAIKAAADQMNGQWNIGDIKIPTPYEARRYIQASGQGQSYQSTATTNVNNNQFSFAGLTRQEVEQLLRDVLGPAATQASATTPRK